MEDNLYHDLVHNIFIIIKNFYLFAVEEAEMNHMGEQSHRSYIYLTDVDKQ